MREIRGLGGLEEVRRRGGTGATVGEVPTENIFLPGNDVEERRRKNRWKRGKRGAITNISHEPREKTYAVRISGKGETGSRRPKSSPY